MDDAGVAAIGAALDRNSSLHTLCLPRCKPAISSAAVEAVLQHSKSLHSLYLGHSDDEFNTSWCHRIDDAGAAAIGAALKRNASLHTLILWSKEIGDEGAAVIGAALERNTSLHVLVLEDNKIGDAGAAAIGTALERNTSHVSLSLRFNEIGDAGGAAIGAALERNTSLQVLDLIYNNIRSIGVEFLNTQRLCTFSKQSNSDYRGLYFHFDRLIWPPPSVSRQGRNAVCDFLEAVKHKSAPLTRSHIMSVGAGGSGKTTLKTALMLRGTGARDVLPKLRERIVETIEARWSESNLRGWVDDDLACKPGFYGSLGSGDAVGVTARSGCG